MTDLTAAQVLADSLGSHGHRLTTLEVVFPRPYLAEFNTHRALSRNSASSRAIPTEKHIERVQANPYLPSFNARVKGMGVGDPLGEAEQKVAESHWLSSRDAAVAAASALLGTDKSRANRLLEPFMWHTVIVSATEWANFFALRDHQDAQPEVQKLARMMRLAMERSTPRELNYGEWHLPLVTEYEVAELAIDTSPLVSAGRCARVSYDTHWRNEDPSESRARWELLSSKGHWSPGEHPAQCSPTDWVGNGNFRGWKQLRKMYPGEAVFQG